MRFKRQSSYTATRFWRDCEHPNALNFLEQGRQGPVDHDARHADHELVPGHRTVTAQHAHLADVDAEAAEKCGHLSERAGPVGEFDDYAT